MYEGNLPAGASDDSNAPYNQRDLGTACATKNVVVYLSKVCCLETDNVVEDEDEDGKCVVPADNADWRLAFHTSNDNPIALFGVLKSMCESKIEDLKRIFADDPKKLKEMTTFYENIAKACEGWQIDELDIDDI